MWADFELSGFAAFFRRERQLTSLILGNSPPKSFVKTLIHQCRYDSLTQKETSNSAEKTSMVFSTSVTVDCSDLTTHQNTSSLLPLCQYFFSTESCPDSLSFSVVRFARETDLNRAPTEERIMMTIFNNFWAAAGLSYFLNRAFCPSQ